MGIFLILTKFKHSLPLSFLNPLIFCVIFSLAIFGFSLESAAQGETVKSADNYQYAIGGGRTLKELKVWISRATQRVFKDDPPGETQSVFLKAVRGEYAPFQLSLRCDEGEVNQVMVTASDLISQEGNRITSDNLDFYREYYICVEEPSPFGVEGNERKAGDYPDALIPFYDPYSLPPLSLGAPFDVIQSENQTVFVDLFIPSGSAPGTYSGTLTISAPEIDNINLDIHLDVYNITLPSFPSVTTAYGLSFSGIRLYHGGPEAEESEDYPQIVRNYEDALHKYRIDIFNATQNVECPFIYDLEGHLVGVDFTSYDQEMTPRISGEYYSDGRGIGRFNAGFFCPGQEWGLEDDLTDADYTLAAALFCQHLKEKGWLDRTYIYVLDEPWKYPGGPERIAHDVALMIEGDPDWDGHFLVTGPFMVELEGYIDIWCPVTREYDDWDGRGDFYGRDEFPERFALGEALWFYVCIGTNPPYAGYDIDTKLNHEPIILKWGCWYEKASGFLYWTTNFWYTENPWGKVRRDDIFGENARNGDGLLLYPGDHDGTAFPAGSPPEISIDGPIVSYRLKMIREGLEDWELFRLIEKRQRDDPEFLREQVGLAYRQLGIRRDYYDPLNPPWTLDDAVLYDIKAKILQHYAVMLGDIDDDGRITTHDALLCFWIALGMYEPTPEEFYRADVDQDGRVTTSDALWIFQEALGLPHDQLLGGKGEPGKNDYLEVSLTQTDKKDIVRLIVAIHNASFDIADFQFDINYDPHSVQFVDGRLDGLTRGWPLGEDNLIKDDTARFAALNYNASIPAGSHGAIATFNIKVLRNITSGAPEPIKLTNLDGRINGFKVRYNYPASSGLKPGQRK